MSANRRVRNLARDADSLHESGGIKQRRQHEATSITDPT